MSRAPSTCRSGKVRYRDRIAALLALSTVSRRDSPKRPKSERRAYPCPHCNGWHLTSKRRAYPCPHCNGWHLTSTGRRAA